MLNKLKSIILDDTIYVALLLVVVAVGSYGLGRLSQVNSGDQVGVVVRAWEQAASSGAIVANSVATTSTAEPVSLLGSQSVAVNTESLGEYVASKSGTKYHKRTCGGAKNIKDTNKIYFTTETEAQASGYTRAANCKF